MNQPPPALRVERAKLVNPRPGDRERLVRALEQVTPASTGIPADALLLVRCVRVDRPLAAGVERFGGELVDRIRAARVSARRGTLGAGDSVYFEDSHALEAAIVGAWLGGERLPDVVRRSIADSETPLLRWRRRWLADVRNLPALVAILVATGAAAPWFARFEESELIAATERLICAYGGDAGWDRAVEARDPARSPATEDSAEALPSVTSRPTAIIEAIAVARASTPQVAVRRLIAVALLAVRRPALVATRAFSEALVELAAAHAPRARRATASPPPPIAPSLDGEAAATAPPADQASTDEPQREARGHARSTRSTAADSTAATFTQAARQPSTSMRSSPEGAPEAAVRPTIASEYAGLFFLLNMFLSLGLYGDFTDPTRRLRGLSPFELLLILGRHWRGADFAKDQIEPALRSLAGLGPGERVGRDFEASVWEAPSDWLNAWEPGPMRVLQDRFGMSRWHHGGFPVADRWHAARAPAWLRRRWLACLARYIAARLARAFGMADPRQAVASLIALPGEIRVDPEHVEVSFALDTHPLAIRLAGLDRDPGWIPAAGRSVEFRFT